MKKNLILFLVLSNTTHLLYGMITKEKEEVEVLSKEEEYEILAAKKTATENIDNLCTTDNHNEDLVRKLSRKIQKRDRDIERLEAKIAKLSKKLEEKPDISIDELEQLNSEVQILQDLLNTYRDMIVNIGKSLDIVSNSDSEQTVNEIYLKVLDKVEAVFDKVNNLQSRLDNVSDKVDRQGEEEEPRSEISASTKRAAFLLIFSQVASLGIEVYRAFYT